MSTPGFLPDGTLDYSDPNIWDYTTGNLKPQYQAQAAAQFDPSKAVPEPVLTTNQNPGPNSQVPQAGVNQGVLTAPGQGPNIPGPVLTVTPNTTVGPNGVPIVDKSVHTSQLPPVKNNTPLPQNVPPTAQQGYKMPLHEKLGRMGGAMMSAGSKGGMAQWGAGGEAVGEIGNVERKQTNADADRYASQQQARDKAAADAQKIKDENNRELDGTISDYDSAIAEMDRLYGDVLGHGDNLTGPHDGYIKAFFNTLSGDPKAYTRLAMDQFKVDQILINVAKTKGAISDREMATFERPMPSMMADEKIWLDWINAKRNAAISVSNKLKVMRGGTQASGGALAPDDQAILDMYSSPQPPK